MITFYILAGVVIFFVVFFVHDKYVQRSHQLLINYPIIGRMRYVFEALREPLRQYFAKEEFYQSRDKISWVYKTAKGYANYTSFSPEQAFTNPKIMFKHALFALNTEEVEKEFSVTIGRHCRQPFVTKSVIFRSAMSDGSLSPEATKAYSIASYKYKFPINTGEGGFTSNFLDSHKRYSPGYMEVKKGHLRHKVIYKLGVIFFNKAFAHRLYKRMLVGKALADTYLLNTKTLDIYRPNWSADIEYFPTSVPDDVPDIIFQVSSGLYSVRDKEGKFDFKRYEKIARFIRATEIKIAQGAKQIGGRVLAKKVTPAIAYYRGIEPYTNVESPNKFPYANSVEELFDFIGQLKEVSGKPAGIKIVVSSEENIEPLCQEIRKRLDEGSNAYPDFINVDGGDGGSGTAPITLMERVGLTAVDAVHLSHSIMKKYRLQEDVKLFCASKVLTPDDLTILLALGADMIGIGRGFMMSAGCIRARHCSGAGKMQCPVGLATQEPKRRAAFIIHRKVLDIGRYHDGLVKGLREILAVLGLKKLSSLNHTKLQIIDSDGYVHKSINRVLDEKLQVS